MASSVKEGLNGQIGEETSKEIERRLKQVWVSRSSNDLITLQELS